MIDTLPTADRAAGRPPARSADEPSAATFAVGLGLVVALALALRIVFPLADPPSHASVGVTWHDEGAWVHNARNRALFGAWKLDEWNPMYLTPVFTGLEYLSFRTLGVGLWQARLVSELAGAFSVLLLGLGVARVANRAAGLIAAALLATNYAYVMFDRAALMEATLVAWMVAAWYCYARAGRSPVWGLGAGLSATLAFFTKASAAAFIAALGTEALLALALVPGTTRVRASESAAEETALRRKAAAFTLVGLASSGLALIATFVGPNWREYRFYTWEVSVARKPRYDLRSIIDRASWLPIVHDTFTRMWLVTVLAAGAALSALGRLGRLVPAERLLLLWLAFGIVQLVLHHVGNERYLMMLVPPIVALAAIALGRDRRLLAPETGTATLGRALLSAPLVLFTLYIVAGGVARLAFLRETRMSVRLAAAIALAAGAAIYATWPRTPRWLSRERWSIAVAVVLTALATGADILQFGQWAAGRTYKNYAAMRELADWLPPDTKVHGKLANGLALESRIRPVFVGRGFGNYADRMSRDDVQYLLTYIEPRIGYEGPVIAEVLAAYPAWRIVRVFDVSETPGGHDRAALIDKRPAFKAGRADRGQPRAHD